MAKNRNCPNCGAPYETEEVRCPYCVTAYFDMSMINMDAHEPFYLKIKVNGYLITQMVYPSAMMFESKEDELTAYGGLGNTALMHTCVGRSLLTDLPFRAIAQKGDILAKIQKIN